MFKQTYKFSLLLVIVAFISTVRVQACPPPVTIEVNCPSGDCDIVIITGNDNEVNSEGKKGPVAEVIDDILDFFRDIFKKKDNGGNGGGDGGDGGNSGGSGNEGGDAGNNEGGGTPSGGNEEESTQSASTGSDAAFYARLGTIADYFDRAKITEEGVILHYTPAETCQSNLTLSLGIEIPIPQNWLKKHKIVGKRSIKAGKYTTKSNGRLFLPFKKG